MKSSRKCRLELVAQADDGSATYRMHIADEVCEFDIYKSGLLWGCSGINFRVHELNGDMWGKPGERELSSLCHEAGWLHLRRKSTVRSVVRSAVREAARRRQRRQIDPAYQSSLERLLDIA